MKAIHDVYARDETFIDFFSHDLDDNAAWFNNSEFARFHNVNGKKILSVFTADTRTRAININIGNESPASVNRSSGVLYCRAQEISGLAAEQPLRLDGRLYTVAEARLIQDQVWRIVLEANNA